MSADITAKAQEVGNNESRKEFVDACESLDGIPQVYHLASVHGPPLIIPTQIGPKTIASEATKFVESRQKILEGIAKGMLKIAAAHA